MSIFISLWIERSDNPVNLSVVIVDRNGDLVCLSTLNDLSAEQVVTGKVHRMVIRVFILGYIEVVCFKVSKGEEGKLAFPYLFSCSCHFIFQHSSSLCKLLGDGKSCWYIFKSCSSLATLLSDASTKMEGTNAKL